ncbi:hypothetical protein [Streptomyces lydicus]|uniref:hypothetical protein n=1 Tax=Streptomyces lydicus TaxID=47763 RepID=UPI0036E504A3
MQHDGQRLLLAEVWVDETGVRRRLITAPHTVAARQQLTTVPAVTRQNPADFVACGMQIIGRALTRPGKR